MLQYYRFLSMFLPLASRAQPSTPCSFPNLILNNSSFPKIFFRCGGVWRAKRNRFLLEKYRFFLLENYQVIIGKINELRAWLTKWRPIFTWEICNLRQNHNIEFFKFHYFKTLRYAFSDPIILYQNDRLFKSYKYAEFQSKNGSHGSDPNWGA